MNMSFEFSEKYDLLSQLDDEQIKHLVTVKVKKGEIIYHQGDAPTGVYHVKNGHIGLITFAPNGNETLLRVFGPNYFFGHRSLISNEDYHATTMALVDSELIFIPSSDFDNIVHAKPNILMHVAQVLAKELRRAENKFRDLANSNVTSRIIQALAFIKTRYPDHKWTRKEIGEYCGAKTETVSRVLGRLEKEGLIVKEGRGIVIPSIEKLYERAEELDE
ncbi:cyclic nucleotide-binding domain protein [Bacteriovorax sp. DB6_IX]|nr:cyclic nucleotide-binding domain protein [Bacteriovorax sp. DB6_IX]